MTEPNLLADEIISPEGVEEKLVDQSLFFITLTGGGKYRVYVHNCMHKEHRNTLGVFDDLEAARKAKARAMNFAGAFNMAPALTLEQVIRALRGKGDSDQ